METRKELVPVDHPDGTRVLAIIEKDLDGNVVSESIIESTGKHPILRLEGHSTEHVLPFPSVRS